MPHACIAASMSASVGPLPVFLFIAFPGTQYLILLRLWPRPRLLPLQPSPRLTLKPLDDRAVAPGAAGALVRLDRPPRFLGQIPRLEAAAEHRAPIAVHAGDRVE